MRRFLGEIAIRVLAFVVLAVYLPLVSVTAALFALVAPEAAVEWHRRRT